MIGMSLLKPANCLRLRVSRIERVFSTLISEIQPDFPLLQLHAQTEVISFFNSRPLIPNFSCHGNDHLVACR